jgi:endonuclease/exonuclease/phosphatase (EEP) superfamily protein YafD
LGTLGLPSLVTRIATRGVPLTVLAAHPPPPKSAALAAERNLQLSRLAVMARGAPEPVVLCADLNVTPWTPFFGDLVRDSGLVDARRGRGIQPTWPTSLPPLGRIPIDHCLVSPDLGVRDFRYGPGIGSDHLPVLLTVAVPTG